MLFCSRSDSFITSVCLKEGHLTCSFGQLLDLRVYLVNWRRRSPLDEGLSFRFGRVIIHPRLITRHSWVSTNFSLEKFSGTRWCLRSAFSTRPSGTNFPITQFSQFVVLAPWKCQGWIKYKFPVVNLGARSPHITPQSRRKFPSMFRPKPSRSLFTRSDRRCRRLPRWSLSIWLVH